MYNLLRSKSVKFEGSEFKIVPFLQVSIVLTDGWYCNQPPKDQSVDNQGVSGRNPKAELEKECVKFDNHENNTKAQHLDESPGAKQRVPLIFVPLCWCELT